MKYSVVKVTKNGRRETREVVAASDGDVKAMDQKALEFRATAASNERFYVAREAR